VGGHLLLAGDLIGTDPESAAAHAQAARRRASRLAIVREAAAETAYAAGRYDTALAEYRALRRMTGLDDYLPVMADCQRALGKTDAALRLLRDADEQALPPPTVIELRIVEAGIRSDLGQTGEAIRLLQATISQVEAQLGRSRDTANHRARSAPPAGRQAGELDIAVARLHYALADMLVARQQTDRARTEFVHAAESDTDRVTDAAERVDELDGLVIEFDDEPEASQQPPQDSGADHGRDR
jgi:tetratricopeptide (TPR) repeat protein